MVIIIIIIIHLPVSLLSFLVHRQQRGTLPAYQKKSGLYTSSVPLTVFMDGLTLCDSFRNVTIKTSFFVLSCFTENCFPASSNPTLILSHAEFYFISITM
jgi:hypothetical protein